MMNLFEFLDGSDLVFNNNLIIKNPKVVDVKNIGEQNYQWYINLWTKQPKDMILELWKRGVDFESITDDDFFINEIKENLEVFQSILSMLSNIIIVDIQYNKDMEMDTLYYITESSGVFECMDFKLIDTIREFYKTINFYKESEKREFSDQKAKEKILNYELEELEYDSNNSKTREGLFWRMVMAVVDYNKRSWEYVYDMYIPQLIGEFNIARSHENANRLYTGIYSGSIKYKEVSDSLDWLWNV